MSHLKILDARKVAQSKFHTECPQILGITVQHCYPNNLGLEFVHASSKGKCIHD